MPRCRPALLALVLCALVSTACSSGETATSAQQGTATPTASTTEQVPATVEGREDEVAPPDASFPASVADDSGDPVAGTSAGSDDEVFVTGIRLTPQNGYDRLVLDLNASGVPFWTARYTEASTPSGDPVEVAGDAWLRIGLFTQSSSDQDVVPVTADGTVAEVRVTGSFGGYQEVLIGVRGGAAPFRAFTLTDPGRLVVDIRPAG